MKIRDTYKKLKISFALIIIASCLVSLLLFIYLNQNENVEKEHQKIISDVKSISFRAQEIIRKIDENKKYFEIWARIDDNKKSTKEIKVEELNKISRSLADKYSINDINIKLNPTEAVPSIQFSNNSVSLTSTSLDILFNSFDDVRAIKFVEEILESMHGYPIVTNFTLTKEREYTNQDLKDISQGKMTGLIKAKLSINWFVYKEINTSSNKAIQEP